jgi:hypothetical protein
MQDLALPEYMVLALVRDAQAFFLIIASIVLEELYAVNKRKSAQETCSKHPPQLNRTIKLNNQIEVKEEKNVPKIILPFVVVILFVKLFPGRLGR